MYIYIYSNKCQLYINYLFILLWEIRKIVKTNGIIDKKNWKNTIFLTVFSGMKWLKQSFEDKILWKFCEKLFFFFAPQPDFADKLVINWFGLEILLFQIQDWIIKIK